MSKIKIINYPEAEGRLKEIYDELIKKRGKLAGIHKAQSLRPESIVRHIDLYMEIMFSRSELSRSDREMMAVIVSVSNGCEYCKLHHLEALKHYWRNDTKTETFLTDYEKAGLSNLQVELCRFAEHLTLFPVHHAKDDFSEKLKDYGISDSAILDAILVVSYFNFVNRIVLGTGVKADEDEIKGYKY